MIETTSFFGKLCKYINLRGRRFKSQKNPDFYSGTTIFYDFFYIYPEH